VKDSRGRLIPTVICEWVSDKEKENIAAQVVSDEDAASKIISNDPNATQPSISIKMGWKLHSGEPNKMRAGRCIKALIKHKLIKETRRGNYVLTDEGERALEQKLAQKRTQTADEKACYRGRAISVRRSNKKGTVTRRTCFLLLKGINTNINKSLATVTAVTVRPTTERASALLRGSKVTCYFARGYFCYFLSLGRGATVYNRRQRDRLVVRHFCRLQTTWQPSMFSPTTGVTFTAGTSCLSLTFCAAPPTLQPVGDILDMGAIT
jgi:hypothetical protein